MTGFSMPHWHDPRVVAVAVALWDDNSIHSTLSFPRDEAVKYWPGIEARKFVVMSDALKATTAAVTDAVGTERSGVRQTILPQTEKGS